ncbi:hypothetical protein OQA88_5547 [Cercophora sp. LCS_1]
MHLATLFVSLLATTAAAGRRPCGFKIAPCKEGWTCQKVDPSCNRGENCEGFCIPTKTTLSTVTATKTEAPRPTYSSCGGFRVTPLECAKGYHCVDDPYVAGCGMACDRPGICVPETAAFCGGFAGFQCKGGLQCIDDPRDDCDPRNGGADCGGICV